MVMKQGTTSIVVLAAWNPAIITPEWLLKHKVMEGSATHLRVMFASGGPRLAFDFDKVRWMIDTTRLDIRAQEFVDCGVFVTRVLGLLPHTPVKSIGTNFTFRCPIADWPKSKMPNLGDIQLVPQPKYDDLRQMQWSCVR